MKTLKSHPLRMVYLHMIRRCCNPQDTHYKYYGGRGIEVCEAWKQSREAFFDWAYPLWSAGLEIDRIDNDGHYSPENCRFVTQKENNRNSRATKINVRIAEEIRCEKYSNLPGKLQLTVCRP